MPWKERSVMDERMRFVIRLKDGEKLVTSLLRVCIARLVNELIENFGRPVSSAR